MLIPDECLGTLEVLNISAGDMEFHFDSDDPMETARAERVVKDMLKRGYSIFVNVDGKLHHVKKFDPKRNVYLIADGPGLEQIADEPEESPPTEARRRGRPKGKLKAVAAKDHKATAIAPTAGG